MNEYYYSDVRVSNRNKNITIKNFVILLHTYSKSIKYGLFFIDMEKEFSNKIRIFTKNKEYMEKLLGIEEISNFLKYENLIETKIRKVPYNRIEGYIKFTKKLTNNRVSPSSIRNIIEKIENFKDKRFKEGSLFYKVNELHNQKEDIYSISNKLQEKQSDAFIVYESNESGEKCFFNIKQEFIENIEDIKNNFEFNSYGLSNNIKPSYLPLFKLQEVV